MAVTDYGGPVTAIVGAGQHGRHAVPPGEEPDARPRADRQFPEVAAMILFPAIDLKDGRCVRLVQGDMEQATVFNDDPAAQAARLRGAGLRMAARRRSRRRLRGQADERERRRGDPARASRIPVQLGGGIRDMKTVEGWLAKGVARVIIGTAAVRDPDFVREAARRHPGQDRGRHRRQGRPVAVEGWAQTSSMTADELGRRFEDAGVAAIVYTDIARDGVLKGLNIPMTLALADAVSIPVIASGGLASMADIERLLEPDCASARRRDHRARALRRADRPGRGAGA